MPSCAKRSIRCLLYRRCTIPDELVCPQLIKSIGFVNPTPAGRPSVGSIIMCSVQLPHLLIIARLRFGIRVLQSNVWRFPSWPSAQGRNNNALSGVCDRIKDLDEKGSLSFGKYALVFQGAGFFTKQKRRYAPTVSRAGQNSKGVTSQG